MTAKKAGDRKDVGSVQGRRVGDRLVVDEEYRGIDKPKGKAGEKVDLELLSFQVRRIANELDGVGARLRAISLAPEEVKLLLAELRAVRHLLDRKGEFKHLEAEHAKLEAQAPQPPPSPPSP